jgi:radical SAM-linked protein
MLAGIGASRRRAESAILAGSAVAGPGSFPGRCGGRDRNAMTDPQFAQRWSVCLSKEGDARFLGQLDFGRLVERSLRRSGLPVVYTQGFNPRIRLTFVDALPLGIASEGEWVGLTLTEDLLPEAVRAKLLPALPMRVRVVDVQRGPPPPPAATVRYRLDVEAGAWSAADALTALLERDEYLVQDPRRERTVDARALLAAGTAGTDHLLVDLVETDGRPARPGPLIVALSRLAEEAGAYAPVFTLCTKQLPVVARQGVEPWHDAVASPTPASCSSMPASPKRSASPSSRLVGSTSTT